MKKKKWLEIALKIGSIVTFLVLNLPLILGSYSMLTNPDHTFRILEGSSMTPVLKYGDVALIKRGTEDIRVGDIISFNTELISKTVLHRVIDIQEDPILTFKTKGDANERPDERRVRADQVIGKLISVIHTSSLMTPAVLFPSTLIPAIGISVRVAYCFSEMKTATEESECPPLLDFTTVILMVILAFSGGKLLATIL